MGEEENSVKDMVVVCFHYLKINKQYYKKKRKSICRKKQERGEKEYLEV